MQNSVEVLTDLQQIAALSGDWDAMVRDRSDDLMGLDATSTYCWFESAVAAFPEATQPKVLVNRRAGQPVAILPLVALRRHILGSELCVVTHLHGGRNGVVMASPDQGALAALLATTTQAFPDWVSMQATMVTDSALTNLFATTCETLGYTVHQDSVAPSPFFPLLESSEDFRSGISKSVLQMLRTSRNKVAKLGELQFREFTAEHEAQELLCNVLEIERQSWKHAAGSAITTQPRQEGFYRALFPRAMRKGMFIGLVLYLNDQPIAHIFGLVRDKVFSCLKHSNVEQHDKLSPSYLVVAELVERLRARGVRTFDYMGLTEKHKLRWSERNGSYHRTTLTVYRDNIKGRALASARRIKARLSPRPSTTTPSTSTAETGS